MKNLKKSWQPTLGNFCYQIISFWATYFPRTLVARVTTAKKDANCVIAMTKWQKKVGMHGFSHLLFYGRAPVKKECEFLLPKFC